MIDKNSLIKELLDVSYDIPSVNNSEFNGFVAHTFLVGNDDGKWLALKNELPCLAIDPRSEILESQLEKIECNFDFDKGIVKFDENIIYFDSIDYLGDYYSFWAQSDIIDRLKMYRVKAKNVELSKNAKFIDLLELKELITENWRYDELWDEFLKDKIC
jgi:hypothetical protein